VTVLLFSAPEIFCPLSRSRPRHAGGRHGRDVDLAKPGRELTFCFQRRNGRDRTLKAFCFGTCRPEAEVRSTAGLCHEPTLGGYKLLMACRSFASPTSQEQSKTRLLLGHLCRAQAFDRPIEPGEIGRIVR
jgi:hypothetical protein